MKGLFLALYADGIFIMRLFIVPQFLRATNEKKIINTKILSMHILIKNVFADFLTCSHSLA